MTERAAVAAARLRGRGAEKKSDQAAVDAMRRELSGLAIDGTVVIGEGEMDEAPMLFIGEKVGTGSGPKVDIAVDPLEGTTLCAKNMPGAIATLAMAQDGTLLHAPDIYMDKIAVGPGYPKKVVDLDAPADENIVNLAKAKGVKPETITAMILDRPRHADLIGAVRKAGAAVSLITDGDVAGVIHTADPDKTGIDIYLGIGGAPEGVLAAAALRCIGGQMQTRLVLDTEEKRERAAKMGIKDPRSKYQIEDMVRGDCLFAATGVTDGRMLRGVQFGRGRHRDRNRGHALDQRHHPLDQGRAPAVWTSSNNPPPCRGERQRLGTTRFDPDSLNQIASFPNCRAALRRGAGNRAPCSKNAYSSASTIRRPAAPGATGSTSAAPARALAIAQRHDLPELLGAHHRRPQRRGRCGGGLPRSDHQARDARSACAHRHGGGGGAHRRRGRCAARRSRSSATTTLTARPRRRCWRAFCAIAASIRSSTFPTACSRAMARMSRPCARSPSAAPRCWSRVDCGTTSIEPLAEAKALGLDVVVIDHHQADEELPPAFAIVNPNRRDDLSGLGHLAAVGLTFMTVVAVNRVLRARGFWQPSRPEPDLLALAR